MSILDIIVLTSILDEIEHNSTNETKKAESENPVEVCIYKYSMIVTFNDVDKDQIQDFILILGGYSCEYEHRENEFEILANVATLYRLLLHLTNEFEEIALY